MPDWSYHPLLKPLFFALPPDQARVRVLTALDRLISLPFGAGVLQLMGHMTPPSGLARTKAGLIFSTPVGLGAGVDPHLTGLRALAQFGFGFLEIGPVSLHPIPQKMGIARHTAFEALEYQHPRENDGLGVLAARLAQIGGLPLPIGARLICPSDAPDALKQFQTMIDVLAPHVQFFALELPDALAPQPIADYLREQGHTHRLLLVLRPDQHDRDLRLSGIDGVILDGGRLTPHGTRLYGRDTHAQSVERARRIRQHCGEEFTIIGADGVYEPHEALAYLHAGADLVQINSGFVYGGPGLPKRINESAAYTLPQKERLLPEQRVFLFPAWIWGALLGLGLIISGAAAWWVALTQVVLPYDEMFVGLTRDQLIALNPNLLPFMTHDRVTLAGTMISTGVLYLGLSCFGLRRRLHWAQTILRISAFIGFVTFFLFLGFGYLDPLHLLLTMLLLPLYLLALRGDTTHGDASPHLRSDWRWHMGLWGQLLYVMVGIGLILAGTAIAFVGVTVVLVPEDLVFLNTSVEALQAANERLLPLIAHDRAGFGGNLIANGAAVLLLALWGFREGAWWVWWALFTAGAVGFVGALGVHVGVGYTDFIHLFPAYLGLLLYVLGAVLSYPYLWRTHPAPTVTHP